MSGMFEWPLELAAIMLYLAMIIVISIILTIIFYFFLNKYLRYRPKTCILLIVMLLSVYTTCMIIHLENNYEAHLDHIMYKTYYICKIMYTCYM